MTRTGTYQVALHQGTYFLKLSGHLGFSSSVPFAKIIEVIGDAPDCTGALIDLRDVDMIDSTHLGLIARLALEAQSKLGQQLTIVSTGKHVPHALKTTGLQHGSGYRRPSRRNTGRGTDSITPCVKTQRRKLCWKPIKP